MFPQVSSAWSVTCNQVLEIENADYVFFCSIDELELTVASGSNQVLPTLTLLSRQLWEHEEEAVADMVWGRNEKKNDG